MINDSRVIKDTLSGIQKIFLSPMRVSSGFVDPFGDPKYIIITGFFAVLIGTTADLPQIANGHLPG